MQWGRGSPPGSPRPSPTLYYLSSQVEPVGVGIIEGEQEAGEPVNFFLDQRHGQVLLWGGGQDQPVSGEDGISPPQTPAQPPELAPSYIATRPPSADLVPEGNLSCVPPGDPCREKPLHVPQEHHPVHSVVFAVGLLREQNKRVSQGPRHQGSVAG